MKGLKYILIGIIICFVGIGGYLIGKNSVNQENKSEIDKQIIDLTDYLPKYNMSEKTVEKSINKEELDKELENKAEIMKSLGINIDKPEEIESILDKLKQEKLDRYNELISKGENITVLEEEEKKDIKFFLDTFPK